MTSYLYHYCSTGDGSVHDFRTYPALGTIQSHGNAASSPSSGRALPEYNTTPGTSEVLCFTGAGLPDPLRWSGLARLAHTRDHTDWQHKECRLKLPMK